MQIAVVFIGLCFAAPLVSLGQPPSIQDGARGPASGPQASPTVLGFPVSASTPPGSGASAPPSAAQASKVTQLLSSGFTENRGQFGQSEVRFVGLAQGMRVGLAPSGIFIFLPPSVGGTANSPMQGPSDLLADGPSAVEPRGAGLVHIEFLGAQTVEPQGLKALPYATNYFLGRGPGWTNVPTFQEVVYPSLYEGIDLVYRMTPQGPKYEFQVAGGADETAISLRFEGATSLEVTPAGDLLVHASAGDLIDAAPTALEDGAPTACSYALSAGTTLSFRCQRHSPGAALTIDPLVYATFLGGTGAEMAYRVVAGPGGALYATGPTASTNFPTSLGAYDASSNGAGDAFVARLNENGTGLAFATYLGGSGYEVPWGLQVASNGSVVVAGYTYSANFPTTSNSLYSNVTLDTGNSTEADVFVTRLGANGAFLEYSTYLGGSGRDVAYDLALDSGGNAYVVGDTGSSDFPTTNGTLAFDPSRFANGNPAFVAELGPNGDTLVFCTYLSGTAGSELAYAVEVDASGGVFVAGATTSSDFPTTSGAYDTQLDGARDGFLAKLSGNGSALAYSTLIGGSGSEDVRGLDLSANGSAFIVGATDSSDFPNTTGAFDLNASHGTFISKFDPNGTTLVYSTFLDAAGFDLAVNTAGEAYVVGYASSGAPVTPDAVNYTQVGGDDGYLAILNAAGSDLIYGSFVGGSNNDRLLGIDVDANGTAYLGGSSSSSDFPVSGSAYQQNYRGAGDGVLAKVDFPVQGEVRVLTDPPGLDLELNRTSVLSNATLNCTARTNLTLFAPSPQGSNLTRFVFENWSDGGARNHTSRCYVGAVFLASFSMQQRVNITATPADRNLTVDGSLVSGPQSYWWVNGTSHGVNVTSPQMLTNDARYVFSDWSDGGSMNRTITVDGPLNITATFTLEYLVDLKTTPAGRDIFLDSAPVAGPKALWWVALSTHYIGVDSPQVVNDTRYLFQNWSDGGARNRTVMLAGPLNLTANFATEHAVRLATLPAGRDLVLDGGSAPAPISLWWAADSDLLLNVSSPQVVGDTRYVFLSWSDAGATNRTVRMSAPLNLTATFGTEHFFRLATVPAGRNLTVDGVTAAAPLAFWWAPGSRHDLNITSPQVVGDTRYLFVSWSDGRAINHVVLVGGPLNLTASFSTEHRARVTTTPAGRQLVVDGSSVTPPASWWWAEGSNHTFDVQSPQAVSTTRYQFASWSDGGAQRHTVTLNGPVTLDGAFTVEYLAELFSSPSVLEVVVDGVHYPTPASLWWFSGSVHQVEAPSPQPAGTQRFVFANWSNGGPANQSVSAPASFRLTATYVTEYEVTLETAPPGLDVLVDGTASPSPATAWWAPGEFHTIAAASPQLAGDVRWSFLSWSDSGARSHSLTVSGPRTISAQFQAEYLVTFDSDPAGLPVEVDGSSGPAPRSFWWRAGETHQIGAPATVPGASVRYLFSDWSDAGQRTHALVVSGAGHLVARFSTEFEVRVATQPAAFLHLTVDGANVTAPVTLWWASGSVHNVGAQSPQGTGASRHVFRAWADGSAPQERAFTANSGGNLTALFDLEFLVTIATTPSGLVATVDGQPLTTPVSLWWVANSTHSLALEAEQSLAGTRYQFDAWSQGGSRGQNVTATAPGDLRATFAPAPASNDSGGFQGMLPLLLVVGAAGAGLALVLVLRRRNAALGPDEAEASAAALRQLTDGSSPPAVTESGGSQGPSVDGDLVPCPQCEFPVSFGASACPNCELKLVWE